VATLAATENGWKDIIVLEKAGTGGNSAMAHDLFGVGAMAYLPKDKLGEIVPFLEDVLKYEYTTGWKHLMGKLAIYFDKTFGSYWKTKADVQTWY
jgi:hypothetical protein